MPLLKRKRFDLVPTPYYDATSKESGDMAVWYSPISREIFQDYSEYLKRTALYKKHIWTCESTGKTNLTFKEALDSEKVEKERFQDKLPEQLQKSVLLHVQFQIGRLEAVVDDVYQHFLYRYVEGEILNYVSDDNKTYTVKVLDVIEKPDSQIHYRVQFLVKKSNKIDKENGIKELPGDQLRRERFAFSKNLLKKFVKEYTTKDTYIGAPWIVSDEAAIRFNINTTLPTELQAERDLRYSKSRKKRNEAAAVLAAAETQKLANGSSQPIDARKIEATLKYPIEDLNVPVYRRDPSGSGYIVNMTPTSKDAGSIARNPTGGMPPYPRPSEQSTIPNECFGSFLSVWSFLSVFSQPLKLSPFTLDDFENALLYHSQNSIITESNVALLNAIIKQRYRLKKESLGNGTMAREATLSLYGSGYQASRTTLPLPHQLSIQTEDTSQTNSEDEDEVWKSRPTIIKRRESTVERGCGSIEVEAIGFNWDNGTVDTEDERIGWEDMLIGFINQLAPYELLSDIDRILSRLVPSSSSTLEEREQAYISLNVSDKIKIFQLLIDVANESFVIKSYMDECQDQLTETRKLKIDLSRERKRIHAERLDLQEEKTEESISSESESDEEEDDELKAQRQANRHESRQEAMRRRQQEQKEREAKRLKLHHIQRQEARLKSQEMRKRNDRRKRLEEDQRALHRKEDQVERDMRKYATHRIKPLGRDKFYNRYYYLDDIGGTLLHGSGRLFVQCPSDTDLRVLMDRDSIESIDKNVHVPYGRGGGVAFVSQLLNAQGLEKEAEFFNNRVIKLKQGDSQLEEWWHIYDDPEDIQKLLEWLNPKGIREFRLKRELEKQLNNLTNGMKRRATDQANNNKQEQVTRRTTRSKTVVNYPPGSWLSYTNKLADN